MFSALCFDCTLQFLIVSPRLPICDARINQRSCTATVLDMADVRALLAAEKQSRRIFHPHLTYSKSGALTCNVCNLNIKSEQLWPGHVKSLNHRKNVQKTSVEPPRPAKRKIESVETNDDEERNYEVDSRKKPKPASDSKPDPEPELVEPIPDDIITPELPQPETSAPPEVQSNGPAPSQAQVPTAPIVSGNVDEDEWAAFEREVAPLAQQDYASATIEAAPVSAAEVAAQQKTNTVQQREDEAEAEKEDESRRMEEEFEVMEEMEDRINRLRARREALRSQDSSSRATEPIPPSNILQSDPTQQAAVTHDEPSSDEEEVDDWYG